MLENEPHPQTVDEATLLVNCLRGLPLFATENVNWQSLLELAETHRVLPLVHQLLIEKEIEIPEFFHAATREQKTHTERLAVELESLLRQFAARDIDVIPLKGPVLAEALYGNTLLRPCDDLDLLVRRQDFERAETLLLALGFVANTEADNYHRKFFRDGVLVELHFNVMQPSSFPFDLDGLWSRAGRGRFREAPVSIMSDSDLVLFVCLHGLKHWFCRLLWIQDLANALRTMRCKPAELVQNARKQRLDQALFIGCEMAREILPQQLPKEMEAAMAEFPGTAERARRILARMLEEHPRTNGEPEIWGLYLQIESTAQQRWLRRWSLFKPTQGDHAWAERHRIYPALTPLFRPFRLLRKYGPSRVWRILFPPTI